jgi:hypothetical protein
VTPIVDVRDLRVRFTGACVFVSDNGFCNPMPSSQGSRLLKRGKDKIFWALILGGNAASTIMPIGSDDSSAS